VKIERAKRKTVAKPMEDVILFSAGGMKFVIAANAVDEIRNLDGLQPWKGGFGAKLAKVKFTLVREKKDHEKTYFVVDACPQYNLPPKQGERVLIFRGSGAALLVEHIDRMTQIGAVQPLPRAFSGHERIWYRGLAVIGEQVLPVVNPEPILNKGELAVLQAEFKAHQKSLAKAAGEVVA
jgi:chemotaxis signal transduction protein